MKKLLALALSTFMLVSAVGCSSNNNTVETDNVSEEKIIVGLDDSFPPMGFRDENNEIVGFDVDLAKAAAEKMGVEIEFQPIDWSTKEMQLNSDKVDLLWNGLTMTDERVQNMDFTKPYLANRQIIIVKEDSAIATKAELEGKNIGVQKESSAVDAINADEMASKLNLNEYENNVLAFNDLSIGRVDAVVVDEIVARYYIANNDVKFKILDEDFGDEKYGIAAKKGNAELINKLQTALDSLAEEGKTAEISQKWFDEDIYLK